MEAEIRERAALVEEAIGRTGSLDVTRHGWGAHLDRRWLLERVEELRRERDEAVDRHTRLLAFMGDVSPKTIALTERDEKERVVLRERVRALEEAASAALDLMQQGRNAKTWGQTMAAINLRRVLSRPDDPGEGGGRG